MMTSHARCRTTARKKYEMDKTLMDEFDMANIYAVGGQLRTFVQESNKIEGIMRDPAPAELKAHASIMKRKRVKVEHVVGLVCACQPNAILRATPDVPGVRVGNHIAPSSGPKIVDELELLLKQIANDAVTPWAAHVRYETLHPFTDGNGRSGRAIWLWHMTRLGQQNHALRLGFLHAFYYQTLAHASR